MDNQQKKEVIKKYSTRKSTIILISSLILVTPLIFIIIALLAVKKLVLSNKLIQLPKPTVISTITPTSTFVATPIAMPTATPTMKPTPTQESILLEKVFVVTYYGGHNPNSSFDYNNLANIVTSDLNNITKTKANFQIVKNVTWQRPATQNGTNCDQYLSKVQSGNWTTNDWQTTNCWGSGTANYNTMLTENNICDLINSNQIDEVWFFGFGNGGFWEANMTGNGAFWTNGPIVNSTNCSKPTHIMGFNYELTPDYALHSFGHRIEGVMRNFLPNDFSQFNIFAPNGNSSCGTVHFPPNGTKDYDYANSTFTNSDCEDWNISHTGKRTSINCNTWGCNQLGYMTWWLEHIPLNWWSYILKNTKQ